MTPEESALRYAKTFVENELDLYMLGSLNDGNLKEMDVACLGHRIKILDYSKQK